MALHEFGTNWPSAKVAQALNVLTKQIQISLSQRMFSSRIRGPGTCKWINLPPNNLETRKSFWPFVQVSHTLLEEGLLMLSLKGAHRMRRQIAAEKVNSEWAKMAGNCMKIPRFMAYLHWDQKANSTQHIGTSTLFKWYEDMMAASG